MKKAAVEPRLVALACIVLVIGTMLLAGGAQLTGFIVLDQEIIELDLDTINLDELDIVEILEPEDTPQQDPSPQETIPQDTTPDQPPSQPEQTPQSNNTFLPSESSPEPITVPQDIVIGSREPLFSYVDEKVTELLDQGEEIEVIVTLDLNTYKKQNLANAPKVFQELPTKALIKNARNGILSLANQQAAVQAQSTQNTAVLELESGYDNIPTFSVKVNKEGLEALIASGSIKSVHENTKMNLALAESLPLINAPTVWEGTNTTPGVTGVGQTNCII